MLLGIAHDIRHGSLLPARVVYGSIWKQRYFTKIGNDYYPEPVTWAATSSKTIPTGGLSFILQTT